MPLSSVLRGPQCHFRCIRRAPYVHIPDVDIIVTSGVQVSISTSSRHRRFPHIPNAERISLSPRDYRMG